MNGDTCPKCGRRWVNPVGTEPPPPERYAFECWSFFGSCTRPKYDPEAWIMELKVEVAFLRRALERIADHRALCHAHDDDMGHPRRSFDEDEVARIEEEAREALEKL